MHVPGNVYGYICVVIKGIDTWCTLKAFTTHLLGGAKRRVFGGTGVMIAIVLSNMIILRVRNRVYFYYNRIRLYLDRTGIILVGTLRFDMKSILLRPPRGSVKVVSTKFTDLVPMEQFHHKPMGMYDGGLLRYVFDGIAPMAQGL